MKKCISLFLAVVLMTPLFAVAAKGLDSDALSAECAALMCVQTGELLFEKNAHTRHSMASTTKIMTSLIALEQYTPSRQIKVSPSMLRVEGTSMGLAENDIVSLETLVYGMLLESGNDAANVTACAVAGSIEKFAVMMNERAKLIGMENTNFVTPSGLDDENHYSTAYDMALLGCCAVKNPEFLNICSQKKAVVSFGSPEYERTLYNHNKLLSSYDSAVGIKTGFTKKSGRCLVSCAMKGGVSLVAVTLNAPGDWQDHKKMLDYGFSVIKPAEKEVSGLAVPVVGGEKDSVGLDSAWASLLSEKSTAVILTEKFLYAPVTKGTAAGEVRIMTDGKLIQKISLVVSENIEALPSGIQKESKNKGFISRLFSRFSN